MLTVIARVTGGSRLLNPSPDSPTDRPSDRLTDRPTDGVMSQDILDECLGTSVDALGSAADTEPVDKCVGAARFAQVDTGAYGLSGREGSGRYETNLGT
jgi:hypothetical protein